MTENHIQLAAKLYRARDSVRKLYGLAYKNEIKKYITVIQSCMKKEKIDNEIKAAQFLIEKSKDQDGANYFAVKLLAAAVEIVEPTK